MIDAMKKDPIVLVIFGIPGAGKTTISRVVVQRLLTSDTERRPSIIYVDLDDCVPEWMRDNFSKGLYPTVEQRHEFSISCCNYVDESICKATVTSGRLGIIISFSFVNEDMREHFRLHYPNSYWVLIHTTEEEAQRRIEQRLGHFYKGKVTSIHHPRDASRHDNNEWNFAPVTFPHTIVNGCNPIEENAYEIAKLVHDAFDRSCV
jgi:gluconate kinase